MKAIVHDRYGPLDVLQLREIDQPAIKAGEVLVRVHAASVNPPDGATVLGVPYVVRAMSGLRKPRIGVRGTDLAGTVTAVGANVTGLQALRDVGNVQPGEKVLIVGAGGGIGTFAVQIAKSFGAQVTGVCSTSKLDLVRSLGADHVIDYTQEDFTEGDERYDLILDNVLNHSLSHLVRALNPKGTLVPNGGQFYKRVFASTGVLFIRRPLLSLFVSQRIRLVGERPRQDDLLALKELIESGKVTPIIDRTFPLSQTAEAIGYFREGHARGKVVITI
jgi:NADPH:quinone reductase-like Zn-dependent oxidoreductase